MNTSYFTTHQRAVHQTNQIYKTVKVNFIHPEKPKYEPERVWQRRENHLVVERPDDWWKCHLIRRRDNLKKGYYTLPDEVYQCIGGEVVLDTADLVYENLNCIDKGRVAQSRKEPEVKHEYLGPPIQTDADETEVPEVISRNKGEAGYKKIKDYLKFIADRKAAVRAGMPYLEHISKKEEDKLAEYDIKPAESMVLMSTSNIELDAMKQDRSFQSIESDNLYKTTELTDSDKSRISSASAGLGSTTIGSAELSKSLIRLHNTASEKFDRLKKGDIEYIKCILEVIIILHNMKYKYLKTKKPLPTPLMRILKRQDVTVHRKRKSIKFDKYKRHSTETLLSSDFSNIMLSDRHADSPSPPRNALVLHPTTTFGLFSGRRYSKAVDPGEVRMEAWEDLISLDNRDKLTSQQQTAALQLRITEDMATRTMKWSKATKDYYLLHEERPKLPIWQVIANEKTSGESFHEKKRSKNRKDVAMVSNRMRKGLETLKENVQKTCEAELEQIERRTLHSFKHKYHSLDHLQSQSLFAKHCKGMRELTGVASVNNVDNEVTEVPEVPPAKWFEELQAKIYSNVGSRDMEVNDALIQLSRYSQMGVRTVPYCRAKLCLLVMSMPAYDLCKFSMQLAIKFVLEDILIGQAEEFYHWLHLRNLPLVLIK